MVGVILIMSNLIFFRVMIEANNVETAAIYHEDIKSGESYLRSFRYAGKVGYLSLRLEADR
jgi:hypothetical protein